MPRERSDERVVYILGTSEPIEKKNWRHLAKSIGLLTHAGLKVVLDGNVFLNHDDYQAGTPEQRLAALEEGLNYEVVWPTIGGYSITGMRRELISVAQKYKEKGIIKLIYYLFIFLFETVWRYVYIKKIRRITSYSQKYEDYIMDY